MAEDILLGGSSRAIRVVADATVSEGEAQDLMFPHSAPLKCDQHRIAIDLERPFSQPVEMGAPSRRVGGKLTSAHIRPQTAPDRAIRLMRRLDVARLLTPPHHETIVCSSPPGTTTRDCAKRHAAGYRVPPAEKILSI